MAIQDTLTFIDGLVTKAVTEAQGGNLALINRLGENPSIAYYINNVHFRQIWTQESWAQNFPADFKEVETLQEAYDAAEKAKLTESTVTDLATKLEEVGKQLQEALGKIHVLESAQPAAKKPKSIKETTEPESKADAPAETETEEATDDKEAEADESE